MDREQYQEILNFHADQTIPERIDGNRSEKKFRNYEKQFYEEAGLLFRKNKWREDPIKILRKGETEPILYLFHDDPISGHLGYKIMFNKIKQRYFWPGMYNEIEAYMKSCYQCQLRGPQKKNNPLNPIIPTGPFERIGIDIVGPLTVTERGNRYIIVAMNYFTRWPEARALKEANALTVSTFIYEEIICRHGCSDFLQTDRGTHFVNELITQLLARFEIKYNERLNKGFEKELFVLFSKSTFGSGISL